MFRAAPFITAPNGNCPNDPNRRITHSMKYSTATATDELQIHAMWRNLTNIKLSEKPHKKVKKGVHTIGVH